MPRTARLDIPGVVQHIIVRGVERRPIFMDDRDRLRFADRFSNLLNKTDTECLAWALLSNHFHLLLRRHTTPLPTFMMRLLTSYAVYFNLKYGRVGHLFQNRYKSLVCDEDAYLLELVRYIHLNPLRAGIVSTLEELENYQWCGHGVLLGTRPLQGQNTNAILSMFSMSRDKALESYRRFVADGVDSGDRPDLVGNRGGNVSARDDLGDPRVIGDRDFVLALQSRVEGDIAAAMIPISKVATVVAVATGIDTDALRKRSKSAVVCEARSVFCRIATSEGGNSGAAVARYLCITRAAVSLAARRGESILEVRPDLLAEIRKTLVVSAADSVI